MEQQPWANYLVADFNTGTLTWMERIDGFTTERARNAWNTKNAGKIAGYAGPDGYRRLGLNGRLHLVHRILWEMANGPIPKGYGIDHIDRVPRNNALRNLRLATHAENQRNTGMRSHNTSGVKGVSFDRRRCKWRAQIRHHGRDIHLGRFTGIEEAEAARAAAVAKYHGEYACAV